MHLFHLNTLTIYFHILQFDTSVYYGLEWNYELTMNQFVNFDHFRKRWNWRTKFEQ